MVVGPGVGALVFFPMFGPLAAVIAGYPFGFFPALDSRRIKRAGARHTGGPEAFRHSRAMGYTLLRVVCAEFLEPSFCWRSSTVLGL